MKTVLVLEDEPSLANVLCAMIEEAGYATIRAGNGEEGLCCLSVIKPHLILCDVMMPMLDGFELCRILRANPQYSSTPIILMSAAHGLLQGDKLQEDTVFLSKPFDMTVLLKTVNALIGAA